MTHPPKVWATVITNLNYLPGLLTLASSLREVQTKYPFIAFYTPTFPAEGLAILSTRGIKTHQIPSILPTGTKTYEQDPRFRETWTKLVVFALEEYERIVLLDGDMLVRRNMDELMDLQLDEKEMAGRGQRVFAASHACACNPLRKPHYPPDWVPENCAFTTQHADADLAQTQGAPSTAGVGMLNSGLLVVNPARETYALIEKVLQTPSRLEQYNFPDQELLSDVFYGRWVPLPYVYNGLKTLRGEKVHGAIWRDEEVKNVHYIFARKPWDEATDEATDDLSRWWWEANGRRQRRERELGIKDRFSD